MKTLSLLIAVLFSCSSGYATTCAQTELNLEAALDLQAACQKLGLSGQSQFHSCDNGTAQLTSAKGGRFALKEVAAKKFRFESNFIDSEMQISVLTTLAVDAEYGNFEYHSFTNDRYGHLLSHQVCAGSVK